MFKIYGNRAELWQWDLDQKLIIDSINVNEVHFCDGINSQALVCQTYELEGEKVVNIPNILLQDNCDMNVFAFVRTEDGSYTKHREIIKINKRSKPADYVYTETEAKTWEALSKRVDELETGGISNELIAEKIKEYLEENPMETPEIDLSEYATKKYVDDLVGIISITLDSINGEEA